MYYYDLYDSTSLIKYLYAISLATKQLYNRSSNFFQTSCVNLSASLTIASKMFFVLDSQSKANHFRMPIECWCALMSLKKFYFEKIDALLLLKTLLKNEVGEIYFFDDRKSCSSDSLCVIGLWFWQVSGFIWECYRKSLKLENERVRKIYSCSYCQVSFTYRIFWNNHKYLSSSRFSCDSRC